LVCSNGVATSSLACRKNERLSSLKARGQLQVPYCSNFYFTEPIVAFPQP
jgi:hypothetical protein